jgi:hypothetical protein
VTSTVAALAVLLAERAVGAAPAGLAVRVSGLALATAATGSGLGWALFKLAGLMKGNALVAAGAAVLLGGFIVMPKWLPAGTTAADKGKGVPAQEKATSVRPSPATARAAIAQDSARNPTPVSAALRLRVVDTNGLPVPNATVSIIIQERTAEGFSISVDKLPLTSDADGRITLESVPPGYLLPEIRADGYQPNDQKIPADDVEHSVTLLAARTILGTVRDAVTGQPIPSFRVVSRGADLSGRPGQTIFFWGNDQIFTGGNFRDVDNSPAAGLLFKFEADGYAPFITRVLGKEESEVQLDLALQPAAATMIAVVFQDGRPATNVKIGFEMPGTALHWAPGRFDRAKNSRGVLDSTDDAGRFALPPDDTITRVFAVCPDGYAEATPASLATEPTMRLQPWGRLEGTMMSGGKPAVGRMLTFAIPGPEPYPLGSFQVKTDANGHFAFRKVPLGQFQLFQQMQGGRGASIPILLPAFPVRLGETTKVSLKLYSVKASLRWPAGVSRDAGWQVNGAVDMSENLANIRSRNRLDETADGTWKAADLPAGDYVIGFTVMPPFGQPPPALWHGDLPVVIPDDPPGGVVDAGEIVLKPGPRDGYPGPTAPGGL